jgi:putative ABC transport system ATP-binding protein
MSLVQAENLTKVYGKGETAVTALDHVNLSVDAGEFLAVMGPSGCGKSTLLHLLGGLDRPTEGRVMIDGHSLADLSDTKLTELRRRKIGFVFQFYNLIPVLNATENAALPITLDGANGARAKSKGRAWLEKVGLGNRLTSRPDQLSGGQQQRVAIARAGGRAEPGPGRRADRQSRFQGVGRDRGAAEAGGGRVGTRRGDGHT